MSVELPRAMVERHDQYGLATCLEWVSLELLGIHQTLVGLGLPNAAIRPASQPYLEALRAVRAQVRAVHGLLSLWSQHGMAVVIAGTEQLLSQAELGQRALDARMLQMLESTWCALVAALHARARTGAGAPMALWPTYRALMLEVGAERIEPADLFYADDACAGGLSLPQVPCDGTAVAAARGQLEQAALRALREPDATPDWAALQRAVTCLAGAEAAPGPRRAALQCVAALFEALNAGVLDFDEGLRKMVARLHLQLARGLSPGGAFSPRLLPECLFWLARARPGAAGVDEVKQCWALADQVPADLEALTLMGGAVRALPPAVSALRAVLEDPRATEQALRGAWQATVTDLQGLTDSVLPAAWAPLLGALRDGLASGEVAGASPSWRAPERVGALLVLEHGLTEALVDGSRFAAAAHDLMPRLARGGSKGAVPEDAWPPSVAALLGPSATRQAERVYWREVHATVRSWEAELNRALTNGVPAALWQDLAQRCVVLRSGVLALGHERLAQGLGRLSIVMAQLGMTSAANDAAGLRFCIRNIALLGLFLDGAMRGVFWALEYDETQGWVWPEAVATPGAGAQAGDRLEGAQAKPSGVESELELQLEPQPQPQPIPVASLPTEPSQGLVWADFLTEAAAGVEQMAQSLDAWLAHPANPAPRASLLRCVHTLKGAAQVAGAELWATRLHDWEGQIAGLALPTPECHQALREAFAQVCALRPRAANPPEEAQQAGAQWLLPEGGKDGLNRIWLNALIDDTAELATSCGRLAPALEGARQALLALDDLMTRWHDQWCRAQGGRATSEPQRFATAGGDWVREDPLLGSSGPVAEGVADRLIDWMHDWVGAQQAALRQVDLARREVARQSQRVRALQHSVRQATKVVGGRIAPRLRRVAEQAAQHEGKQVKLELIGAALEVDQTTLEALLPALEQLVRNAVVHGIEAPAQRRAQGKPEAGQLRLSLNQAGASLVVECADDGAGLDRAAMAARAKVLGLSPPSAEAAASAWLALLTHAGFSTAATVTERAGRGLGLDVVRSAVTALGGQLDVHTATGSGTRFVLKVPVASATLSVVALSAGATRIAVPAEHLERVMRGARAGWDAACASGGLPLDEARPVPCIDLSRLLEMAPAASAPPECALAVLQSGGQRWALRVDRVSEPFEVRLKDPGPQLARLPGILGVALVDEIEAVLIFDLVQTALGRTVVPDSA